MPNPWTEQIVAPLPPCPETPEMLPEVSLAATTRALLWLSYNRYFFLLVLAAAALLALPLVPVRGSYWAWFVTAPAALVVLNFAVTIPAKHHRKLRATKRSLARLSLGTFKPEGVAKYCGDPCSRVLADQVLKQAGVARKERRRLISEYARQAEERSGQLLIVDRARGVLVTVDGSTVTTQSLETGTKENDDG